MRKKEFDHMLNKNYPVALRCFFLLVLIIGWFTPASALDPKKTINQYGHNVWLRQNGLPANAIYTGQQARDGYLWLGTSAGLFRFDGVSFLPVNTNPADSKVIETISTLCRSRDSSLWIGTTHSGLRRIRNGKIYRYGGKDGLYTKQIRVLLESRNGNLWIGSSYGLFIYANEKFITIPVNPVFITAIAEDSLGRIWVGTHSGVRIFDDAKLKQIDSITIADGLPSNMISSIFTDQSSNVWIGTHDGLVRWWNGSMKTYRWTDGLADNHITTICEDRNHNLWFGTYKGISRFFGGQWSSMTTLDGLTNNRILHIFEDHEGSLWVCTLEGLNRLMDVSVTSYTIKEGLASDYLSGVVETPDKNLYFLSDADGSVTQFKDGRMKRYPTIVGPAYVARDGSLWIGQTGLLVNIKAGKFKNYSTLSGLPTKWISAITEDDKSLIVFVDGVGLQRFANGKLTPYLLKNGKPYSNLEYVVCLYSRSKGPLWIGTTNGLVKIENGVDTTFNVANGLAGTWVNSIHEDRLGDIWVCSPSDGLTRYKDGKLTPFSVKDGLYINEFYCVLTDDQDDLWISSTRGVVYLKRKNIDDYQAGIVQSLTPKVFATADGMKSDECFGEWQPAGWKTHDGRIWFATKKGAVMIDPKSFSENKIPPPVVIEKIVVDQEDVRADQIANLIPGTEKLEFHYTALSFLVPERVLFKYRLDGFDHDWIDAGTRRIAYYMNLPPREYRFRVIACNNDGVWNEVGASFAFRLQPRFYETFWFYALILLVLAGAVFGVYKLRVWRLLRREKELQERIQEALANIKTLSGLIPICSNCKKIRNDRGYWDQLEAYIQRHSEATFSHGICPDCLQELYPDIGKSNAES